MGALPGSRVSQFAIALCYFTLQFPIHWVHSHLILTMPRNKTAVNNLGTVYAHGAEFRAHIHFRDDAGKQRNILGPNRGSQHEAQKDLD